MSFEDETYMLSKKYAQSIFRIRRMILKVHVFLFCPLKNTRLNNGIQSFKYERYVRVVATFMRLLKKCETLRLSRTQAHGSICASICNQTRLVCAYAKMYNFDRKQKQKLLKKHQKIYKLLSRLYPSKSISDMLKAY